MKNPKKTLIILFILLGNISFAVNVSGTIKDTYGTPLPYASVYIKGTTVGTSTNMDGEFSFEVEKGSQQIVFQYIGFKKQTKAITANETPIVLHVILVEEISSLETVIISANAEDPAYPIIRKSIEKRKYYLKLNKNYSYKAYTKGVIEMTDMPATFMGDSLVTENDSSKLGIVYLSESESSVYHLYPNKIKEEMISSKISGDDRGFSFNYISFLQMNFYKNIIKLPFDRSKRGFITPISTNALFYYKYKLAGSFIEDGRTIFEIDIIPKREADPVLAGKIFIVDELWRIHSLDVTIGKKQMDFADSAKISLNYFEINDSVWMPFGQSLHFDFSLNFIGKIFKGNGIFHSQNTNYAFDIPYEKNFFSNERVKVNEDANQKNIEFWKENRAIPLTEEEKENYKEGDSLQIVWNSKEYRDSIDKVNNRFKLNNLIFGYSYHNSTDSTNFSISSPISLIQFNTVQGFNTSLGLRFRKQYDWGKYLRIKQRTGYGFANKKWFYETSITYNYNPKHFADIKLSAGSIPIQFNEKAPISPIINSLYTLLGEKNYIKLYQKNFISIYHKRELFNGFTFITSLEYAKRKPLQNNSDYTWVDVKNRDYTPNSPINRGVQLETDFPTNNALIFSAKIRFRFKQQYMLNPHKIILGSKFPDITFHYKKGIKNIGKSTTDFDLIEIGIKGGKTLGLLGESKFAAKYGNFINNKKMEFMDFHHFMGNQTIFSNVFTKYRLLDYYEYSTNNQYFEAHFEHHFNGFLINKIPLLRKTKWRSVGGFRYLSNDFNQNYYEFSIGLKKNLLKLFAIRIEYVISYDESDIRNGIIINIPINNNIIITL